MKILTMITNEEFLGHLKALLDTGDEETEFLIRSSRLGLYKEVEKNGEEIDVILIMDGTMFGAYPLPELVALHDITKDSLFIVLLNEEHKGDDYIRTLYNECIYNAINRSDYEGNLRLGTQGMELWDVVADHIKKGGWKRTTARLRYNIKD